MGRLSRPFNRTKVECKSKYGGDMKRITKKKLLIELK